MRRWLSFAGVLRHSQPLFAIAVPVIPSEAKDLGSKSEILASGAGKQDVVDDTLRLQQRRQARDATRDKRQLWQSSGVRRVSFFSAAYFSAADFTIGLMIWLSASYQSDEKFHFVPSQVWMRA